MVLGGFCQPVMNIRLLTFQNCVWSMPAKEHMNFTVLPTGAITWDDGQGLLTVAPAELLYTGLVQIDKNWTEK